MDIGAKDLCEGNASKRDPAGCHACQDTSNTAGSRLLVSWPRQQILHSQGPCAMLSTSHGPLDRGVSAGRRPGFPPGDPRARAPRKCFCLDCSLVMQRPLRCKLSGGVCHPGGFLATFNCAHYLITPATFHKGATALKRTLKACENEIGGIVNTGLLMSADLGVVAQALRSYWGSIGLTWILYCLWSWW